MKVAEGERIPGLEDAQIIGPDEPIDKTVSEICEEKLEDIYEDSWLSGVFRRVDATSLEGEKYSVPLQGGYYDGGGGLVTFDKYARATDLTDGWTDEWLQMLVTSMEDEALDLIREECPVVHNEHMSKEESAEHFKEEHGFHNAERFRVRPDVYLYASPDMFGYDVVRREWTVEHRCNLGYPYNTNYAIASTRRGFMLNATAVIYDLRSEMQRKDVD